MLSLNALLSISLINNFNIRIKVIYSLVEVDKKDEFLKNWLK